MLQTDNILIEIHTTPLVLQDPYLNPNSIQIIEHNWNILTGLAHPYDREESFQILPLT